MSDQPAAVTPDVSERSLQYVADDIAVKDVKACVTSVLVAPTPELPQKQEAVWNDYEKKESQKDVKPCVTDLQMKELNSDFPLKTYETFISKGTINDVQSDVKLFASNYESCQESYTHDNQINQRQDDIKPYFNAVLNTQQNPETFPADTNHGKIDVKPSCIADLLSVSSCESRQESRIPYDQTNHQQIAVIDNKLFDSKCDTSSENLKKGCIPFPVYFKENEVSKSLPCLAGSYQPSLVYKENQDNGGNKRTVSNTVFNSAPDSIAAHHPGVAKLVSKDENLEIDIACEQLSCGSKDVRHIEREETLNWKPCGEGSQQESLLEKLLKGKSVVNEKKFKCNECGKGFTRKRGLTVHKTLHTGERPFKCDECGKDFRDKGTLVSHMRIHWKDNPYKCKECGKCFFRKSDINAHKKYHPDSFTRDNGLAKDVTIHLAEETFKCDKCGECFNQKVQLDEHMSTHTEKKPFFMCMECKEKFSHKGMLKAHMKTHTTNEPTNDLTVEIPAREKKMSSASTIRRKKMKEEQPKRWALFKEKERERAKVYRAKKKGKWSCEPLTRAMEDERDKELTLQRERSRQYYWLKKRGVETRSSGAADLDRLCTQRRSLKDLTPEEFRLHKNRLRAESRARQSPQKKRCIKEKDREYRRQRTMNARASGTSVTSPNGTTADPGPSPSCH